MDAGNGLRRAASIVIAIVVIAALFIGAAVIASSFLPYEPVKSRIDSMAADGTAEDFDREAYAGVKAKLRIAGVALLLFAALVAALKNALWRLLQSLFESFGELWRESMESWKEALRNDGRLQIISLCVIVLVSVAVRVYFIDQPIRYDEAHSFTHFSSKPIYIALSNYSSVNNHLFHTLLVHVFYSVLGNEEWVLRLPAFLAGILLVPATYLAARALYSKSAAILAAALVASSSALVEFSTNARGYTLICLLFMCLLSLGAHLKRRGGAAAWTLFTIISALGFYTIPVMLYPFGITCVWLFLSALLGDTEVPPRPFIGNLVLSAVLAAAITLVLYTPVFVGSGFNAVFGIPSLAAQASGGWKGFTGGIMIRVEGFWDQWNRDFPKIISGILAAAFAISLVLHGRLARHKVPLVLAVILWCGPVMIAMRALPWPRVWLYLLPLYFILASAGLAWLIGIIVRPVHLRPARPCAIVALIIVLGVGANVVHRRSVYYSEETGTLRNAEEIALTLGPELGPNEKLLAYSPAGAPLLYYFKKHGIPLDRLVSEDPASWDRVYVVVDVPTHTLDWVLSKTGLEVTGYDGPKLFKRYDFAEIYLYQRP